MSNYKYPTPQLLLKAICNAIRAKTGSNDKIAHQDIPDELNNIVLKDYYEEQIENISSIYTGTNLNFSISNNDIKSIARYKFYGSGLTIIDLPECTSIGEHAFDSCKSLITVNLPKCTSIGTYAFGRCTSLTTVKLPKCTSIGDSAFLGCTSLATVNLPECTNINGYAFEICTNLTTVILSNNQVATLKNIRAFNNSAIANGTGYIYVPDNLVDSYKSDTNWSTYANQIKPLSELPSNLKEEYGYD